jgi:DNA (cytosine-5)-methyltransferase 1
VHVLEGLAEENALPMALMIENVVGFLSSNDGEDFRIAVRALNDLGYRADAVQVSAERFTPQSRPRLFLLGVREDLAHLTMALPEQMGEDEWIDAVEAASHVRPKRVRELMTGGAEGQSSLFEDEQEEALRWGATSFPELPQRTQDFSDVVEWASDSWWTPERTAKALNEMNPLHQAKVERMVAASAEGLGLQAATAYRRRRNGRSVYEVRSDGVAGCLRTARGGSSTQIVVVSEDGEVRMRWMSPREYARLQGCEYQEALDSFGDAALKTAFGDAVCVPAVRWIAEHAFGPLKELADAPEPVAQGAEVRG